MKFVLTIDSNINCLDRYDVAAMVGRVITKLVVDAGDDILDCNGNKVGRWDIDCDPIQLECNEPGCGKNAEPTNDGGYFEYCYDHLELDDLVSW